MELGMVGLGRMGGNMAERLRRGGHTVVGYDHDQEISDVASLDALVDRLARPRAVWTMVPAGAPTLGTLSALGELLEPGDIAIDGGNSHYVDDRAQSDLLAAKGIGFVDVGVSGGIWGLARGYALMVGGEPEHVRRLMPIFEALKPPGEFAFVHAGPAGAGHFAKMVHNGIEYGMMQALAEGYELLSVSEVVTDVHQTFRSWREGTVIRSWLLDLIVRALDDDPDLSGIKGSVPDSGEGRWTVQAAVDNAVPLPVISAALFARFSSRDEDSEAMKVVAALRQQFGGHAVAKPTEL